MVQLDWLIYESWPSEFGGYSKSDAFQARGLYLGSTEAKGQTSGEMVGLITFLFAFGEGYVNQLLSSIKPCTFIKSLVLAILYQERRTFGHVDVT
ncbi:hypothetical protein GB937_005121 [Aspergillus fischeri]|nr:hypothetical protein GB937_005121 [Aspergillus fischeri]